MPTLETIYKNINSGATYGQNVRGCAGNVYYAALSVSDDGRYINYSNYGSSAVANTPEELCWILETIFRKTPEEFTAAYVLEPCGRWIELSDADKFDALKAACSAACALKPANVRAAGGCKPAELIGDAWIRLETRLQSGDPRPLRDQLLFSALDALRHEARENTHSVGGSAPADSPAFLGGSTKTNKIDGGPAERAHKVCMRGATARPLEDAGEIRDAINAAAGDDIDAAIIRGAAAGYTSDDIGAVIGMSGQAVRKRLSAIRARIAAYRGDTGAAMPAHR